MVVVPPALQSSVWAARSVFLLGVSRLFAPFAFSFLSLRALSSLNAERRAQWSTPGLHWCTHCRHKRCDFVWLTITLKMITDDVLQLWFDHLVFRTMALH